MRASSRASQAQLGGLLDRVVVGVTACLELARERDEHEPFSTATPNSAMKPTAAEIENGRPRSKSATMPPTTAKGTLRKMMTAARRERNASQTERYHLPGRRTEGQSAQRVEVAGEAVA